LESLAPRLVEFAGLITAGRDPYEVLLRHFRVDNAWDQPRWSRPLARERVLGIINVVRPKVVVCLGRRAGNCLDINNYTWNAWETRKLPPEMGTHRFLVSNIPHPSGKCRVYNDLDERKRAHFTLRKALEAAERLEQGESMRSVLTRLRV